MTNNKKSRQARYQDRMKKRGLCVICGKARSKNSNTYCDYHLEKARERSRNYYIINKDKVLKRYYDKKSDR